MENDIVFCIPFLKIRVYFIHSCCNAHTVIFDFLQENVSLL